MDTLTKENMASAFNVIYGGERIANLMGYSRSHWQYYYAKPMKEKGCVWSTHRGSRKGKYRTLASTPFLINIFLQEYHADRYNERYQTQNSNTD